MPEQFPLMVPGAIPDDILPENLDFPFFIGGKAGEDVDRRGFAGTVRSQEAKKLLHPCQKAPVQRLVMSRFSQVFWRNSSISFATSSGASSWQ